jgi:hypothetical protein
MMKDRKMDYWTADNQDGAIHQLGEHNFPLHEHATKNQNGCSSLGYKNLNLIQTQDWRNWCSFAHVKNYKIVPNMDNHLNYGKGWSNVSMVHVGKNW